MRCVIRADLTFDGELAYWRGDCWTNNAADAHVYDSEELAQAEIAMNISELGIEGVWGEDAEIVPMQ